MKIIQNSIFLLLFTSFSILAQENDFQSWYSISFKKKVVKKTDVTLKTGLRLRENSSLYSKNFVDLRLKRVLSKRFAFVSGYRYIINRDDRLEISNLHRFYADIIYKNKLAKRLRYSVRNRLQIQGNIDYNITFRQKFLLTYNIRKTKVTPNIATEYFFRTEDGINKLRSTISLAYPINKDIDFDLAYRIQKDFNINNPENLYILEVKISYNL